MTTALKTVFSKIENFPIEEQNALAKLISEELKWKKSIEKSQNELSFLAAEAIEEYKTGKTKPLKL